MRYNAHLIALIVKKYDVLRKEERPQYQKHKSTRKSGWDHMECDKCNSLQRDIQKYKKEGEGKKQKLAQKDYDNHMSRAAASREKYRRRRDKARLQINKDRGYVSMIIDGAGAQARSKIL